MTEKSTFGGREEEEKGHTVTHTEGVRRLTNEGFKDERRRPDLEEKGPTASGDLRVWNMGAAPGTWQGASNGDVDEGEGPSTVRKTGEGACGGDELVRRTRSNEDCHGGETLGLRGRRPVRFL